MILARKAQLALSAILIPVAAFAQPYFSELLINPPGPDQGYESIELLGEPGLALSDHWILVIAGDGSEAGVITHMIDLAATQLGSEGLLLIRDDISFTTLPVVSATTPIVVHDFTPDLRNGTTTYVLATGAPWVTSGFDLDFNNDGTIDFPLMMTVVDAVSFSDSGSSDHEYAAQLGGTQLGRHSGQSGSYSPDALYRILTASGDVMAWAGGDVQGPAGGPWTWTAGQNFGFERACLTSVSHLGLDLGSMNWTFLPYADCDKSTGPGVLDIFDFLCFADSFVRGGSYACDCDNSTGPEGCDIFDFICFQRAFVTGCK